MKKKYIKGIVIIVVLVLFSYIQNNMIDVTKYTIKSEKLPSQFDDYKIVQLSDLHSKGFGANQNRLVKAVKKVSPDAIFITGDLVDSSNYDEEVSLELVKQLSKDYSLYFVTGNHEAWSERFWELEPKLKGYGVTVLRNESITLEKGGQSIQLLGIDDPAFVSSSDEYMEWTTTSQHIKTNVDEREFKILLAHRPEQLSIYANKTIDIVFSGHAHGGQFRIPFVGGIVAPNQGLFPAYTGGIYEKKGTQMIVSRGLGNSIIPQRLFNRPNVVVATLKGK